MSSGLRSAKSRSISETAGKAFALEVFKEEEEE